MKKRISKSFTAEARQIGKYIGVEKPEGKTNDENPEKDERDTIEILHTPEDLAKGCFFQYVKLRHNHSNGPYKK